MALTTVYRNAIDAPPISPPRYSLLTAVEVVEAPGVRWEGGYEFISELSGNAGAVYLDGCLDYFEGSTPNPFPVESDPMVVWAEDPCRSTLGTRTRDWQGAARRNLLARQSHFIARRFATDVLNNAVVAPGGAGQPVSVNDGPVQGLAELEDSLAGSLRGPTGVLHMGPGTLAMLVAAGAVRLDGARYVTPIGNVIAADSGYAGGLFVGGDNYGAIVATGPVRVRLGPITLPGETTEWIDPRTNTARVVAMRPATVEVDFGQPLVGADPNQEPKAFGAAILAYPPSGAPAARETTEQPEPGSPSNPTPDTTRGRL